MNNEKKIERTKIERKQLTIVLVYPLRFKRKHHYAVNRTTLGEG